MVSDELKHVRGGLTRRRFLQGLAMSTVAAAGLAGCAPKESEGGAAGSKDGEASALGFQYDWETAEGEIVHGVCPKNCYDTCRICTKVVDGTATATTPTRLAARASRGKRTWTTITRRTASSTR